MIYDRLDKACRARVLAVGDRVLIHAFWFAAATDVRRFRVENGVASNICEVSKEYFEKKYGVAL